MRKILFRGAQKVDGSKSLYWYEGSLIIEKDGYSGAIEYYIQDLNGRSFLVIPKTVGQYTGLTDKNGKKIFEGDILRRAYYPEDDVVIEWSDGSFRFRKANKPKDYGYSSVCCIQNAVSSLKIIGNIHDNPELLKEAEMKLRELNDK